MAASPDHRPRVAAQRRESMRARLLDAGLATQQAQDLAPELGLVLDPLVTEEPDPALRVARCR
ncbi:hypothetical protein [Gemmatimonas sp.]|jgi:hypothetical protein|uniref:hypothetical protein n=1 Tax=Gemmatimonas sp. TaxID=1962908 RepID=UPI0022C555CC|nr:hypothetical protein [Gemmatimonas sp.]MCZ8205848.1 hypothetical protein [Gemmatimonas sp.]